ncbi:hypothetical protein FHX82_000506 [Amycolatopsis bartoniae]|uniref:hypothetical protein n=1 Tax=Amycolatopsis bartoniae TaxID=941986 RepID=UPI00119030A3|nr:hypothetical protein [Amycolatopsis bartoniae]MBB2933486.1 hypothetical protein [Amycolatopsis bartoniae]TVT07589.1 hypothetical protein FNH07_15585 [Amycolatopsis bartoniae]
MLVIALAAAATSVTLAATGVFGGDSRQLTPVASEMFTVHGTVTVNCSTSCLGYGDITAGAQVEIVDNSNSVLAVGYLTGDNGTYDFTVEEVPRGRPLYGAHVGNVNRGVIWESEEQASTTGFALSIG